MDPRKPDPPVTRTRLPSQKFMMSRCGDLRPVFFGFHIRVNHQPYQIFEQDARLPSQNLFCLGCVAKKQIDFCRSEVTRVDLNILLPVEIDVPESLIEEFADG